LVSALYISWWYPDTVICVVLVSVIVWKGGHVCCIYMRVHFPWMKAAEFSLVAFSVVQYLVWGWLSVSNIVFLMCMRVSFIRKILPRLRYIRHFCKLFECFPFL
jgi:hypothetical protein